MKGYLSAIISLFSLGCPLLSIALPYYGVKFSYVLIGKVPDSIRGASFMLSYDPQKWIWKDWDLYFDGGVSQFSSEGPYRSLTIYSIAPVFRFTMQKKPYFEPYLELSLGLSYLNHTRLDKRNLGIHFAFQDRVGIGTFLGTTKQLSLGFHAIHYSNAHLSSHNSGITAPLMLDIAYRFH